MSFTGRLPRAVKRHSRPGWPEKRWPWTDDHILQTYKFCNVFRATDRVSQFMIRDVAYGHDTESTAKDRIFQIVAFRTFSKIQTWRCMKEELDGAPRLEHLQSGAFQRALDQVKAANGGLYTGAFTLCANKAFGFDEKHRNHVCVIRCKAATDPDAIRPPIPTEVGHPFRSKPATLVSPA